MRGYDAYATVQLNRHLDRQAYWEELDENLSESDHVCEHGDEPVPYGEIPEGCEKCLEAEERAIEDSRY